MELIKNCSNVSRNSRCSDYDRDVGKGDKDKDKDKMRNNSRLMVNELNNFNGNVTGVRD